MDVTEPGGVGVAGREPQPARVHLLTQQLLQSGSKNGAVPLAIWATLPASVSTASTSCPNSQARRVRQPGVSSADDRDAVPELVSRESMSVRRLLSIGQ